MRCNFCIWGHAKSNVARMLHEMSMLLYHIQAPPQHVGIQ